MDRADYYYYKGLYDLAIADQTKAIGLDPTRTIAIVERGNAYQRQGKYDLAMADRDMAIELEPDEGFRYAERADTLIAKGEYGAAIADAEKAIRLRPCLASAYYSRGRANAYLGKDELAIPDFDKAITLEPWNGTAIHDRAYAYLRRRTPIGRSPIPSASSSSSRICDRLRDPRCRQSDGWRQGGCDRRLRSRKVDGDRPQRDQRHQAIEGRVRALNAFRRAGRLFGCWYLSLVRRTHFRRGETSWDGLQLEPLRRPAS